MDASVASSQLNGLTQPLAVLVLDEFSVPICTIHCCQERHPFVIAPETEHLRAERRPLGTFRLGDEEHSSFLGSFSALAPVAAMARTDHVLPGRGAASRTRYYMVEIKLGSRQSSSAILASVVVACVDIKARESHMPLRHPFVSNKQQYARNAHESPNYADFFVVDLYREVPPTGEIECAILLVDGARNALVQQREGALNRSYVYGKIRA